MGNEIDVISDGEGVVVFGETSQVERFFLSAHLTDVPSRPFDLQRIRSAASIGGAATEAGIAANAGRWVKLTEESARLLDYASLMAGSTKGTARAILTGDKGIEHILQIVTNPGTLLTNPAVLGGVGAVMSQYAMQQQMNEIVDYLAEIDEKIDDLLRGQKDAVLADMIGVDLVIEDALTVREEVGRVSEVTWSKVQATSQTLARTQAYALRELDAIAGKLKKKADVGEIAKATAQAEPKVREWLAILARTFQLQDGVDVLELDRVLDGALEELARHHTGLLRARQNRLDRIGRTTAELLTQMDETVRMANTKVLFNPFDSPAAVRSSNNVATEVRSLRSRLGIDAGPKLTDARRWGQAAGDALDSARLRTGEGVSAAKRFGDVTFERAAGVFRAVDLDGDGVADESPATATARQAGAAIRGVASGASGAVGSLFKRTRQAEVPAAETDDAVPEEAEPATLRRPTESGS